MSNSESTAPRVTPLLAVYSSAGALVHRLPAGAGAITGLAWVDETTLLSLHKSAHPSGDQSGQMQSRLCRWDLRAATPEFTVVAASEDSTSQEGGEVMAVSGRTCVTGAVDGKLRIWFNNAELAPACRRAPAAPPFGWAAAPALAFHRACRQVGRTHSWQEPWCVGVELRADPGEWPPAR